MAARNDNAHAIADRALRLMYGDCDCSAPDEVAGSLEWLLDQCHIRSKRKKSDDGYTNDLIWFYIVFVTTPALGIGGSEADYHASRCVEACVDANKVIRLKDDARETIINEIVNGIKEYALQPQRELNELHEYVIDA